MAEERDLPLKVIRHVLRAMVVAHREAVRDVGCKATEVSAHALTDWFQSLEACGSRMGVNADALDGTMIHRDEDRRPPFAGDAGLAVSRPGQAPAGRARDPPPELDPYRSECE